MAKSGKNFMKIIKKIPLIMLFWTRVIALLLVAAMYTLRIYFRKFTRRLSKERIAKYGAQWAEKINMVLGVKITKIGAVPDKTAMVISNHRSYMDIPAIFQFLPCSMVAKKEVESWPIIGFVTKINNTIYVDRKDPDSRKITRDKMKKTILNNIPVVIFPEGTSYAGPGILKFKKGAFVTAADTNTPVVPVAVEYKDKDSAWVDDDTFAAHFYRTFTKPKLEVILHFGPAIEHQNPEILHKKTWDWINTSLKNINKGVRVNGTEKKEEILV